MILPGFKASTTTRSVILDSAVKLVFSNLEASYNLVPLAELASISSGGTPLRNDSSFYGGETPWAKIGDITAAKKWIDFTEECITEDALENSAAKLFPIGTVLFSMYGSIGKTAITTVPMTTNQAILGLEPKPGVNPEYLYYCLINARLALFSDAKGTSQKNINGKMVKAFKVPILPTEIEEPIVKFLSSIEDGADISEIDHMPLFLMELRRIVMRIEELAARIEEARELRRRAVEETEALLFAYATEVFGDSNGFTRSPVESFCNVRGGIQKSSKRTPGENPRRYITVAHVQRNWIDKSDLRYFEVSDEELERWRLLAGDVLVIEGNGSADQIGRTAMFRGEIEDCVHQNHVIRIRPDQKRVLPEYLNAYLNSPPGQSQMRERSRTTSGLFNLSVGRIKSIEVLLPSPEVQRRIVTNLDGFQAKIDALKRHQAETAVDLDALIPSILDKAFNGEL